MAEHIVRSYEAELARLNETLVRMGTMTEAQLDGAMEAFIDGDLDRAAEVIEMDQRLDQLERDIVNLSVRLVLFRQPVSDDLRVVIVAPRVALDLERIGDLAKNIAKRIPAMTGVRSFKSLRAFKQMGRLVEERLKAVFDALIARDAAGARSVWERDEEIDELNSSLFRELLTYMMEDPKTITMCTHLLFVAKNLERIGDHCTNIAEHAYFLITASSLEGERPKGHQL